MKAKEPAASYVSHPGKSTRRLTALRDRAEARQGQR
jgi:hypothetical protein